MSTSRYQLFVAGEWKMVAPRFIRWIRARDGEEGVERGSMRRIFVGNMLSAYQFRENLDSFDLVLPEDTELLKAKTPVIEKGSSRGIRVLRT